MNLRIVLIILLVGLQSNARFLKSQCEIDADCKRFSEKHKCGAHTYKCGKRCEAIRMICYLPKEPDPKAKANAEEPINPYKPVQ